jgi:hypothetical protein
MRPGITRCAVLIVVAVLGCGSSKGGMDAGGGAGGKMDAAAGTGGAAGSGGGGAAGGGGAGGRGGSGESCLGQGVACSTPGVLCCLPLVCAGTCLQPPNNQDAGGPDAACVGSAGFGCLFGGCRGDVGTAPVCSNGTFICPNGSTPTNSCGGCTGNPPPGWVCGDGGWTFVPDAGGDSG